ncbi:MAG: retropepsin-like aspartic protease [Caulobacteraceae bacterium]
MPTAIVNEVNPDIVESAHQKDVDRDRLLGVSSRSFTGIPSRLIDTGADGNCIDDALARKLGLPEIDKGEVSGIGGKSMAAMYLARMYIPQLDRLIFEPLAGVRLEEGRPVGAGPFRGAGSFASIG